MQVGYWPAAKKWKPKQYLEIPMAYQGDYLKKKKKKKKKKSKTKQNKQTNKSIQYAVYTNPGGTT